MFLTLDISNTPNSYRLRHLPPNHYLQNVIFLCSDPIDTAEAQDFNLCWDTEPDNGSFKLLPTSIEELKTSQSSFSFTQEADKCRVLKDAIIESIQSDIPKLGNFAFLRFKNLRHVFRNKKDLLSICPLGCRTTDSMFLHGDSKGLNPLSLQTNIFYHARSHNVPRRPFIALAKKLTTFLLISVQSLDLHGDVFGETTEVEEKDEDTDDSPTCLVNVKTEVNDECDLSSSSTMEEDSHITNPLNADVCRSNDSFEVIGNSLLTFQRNPTFPIESPQTTRPTITERIDSNDATQSTTTNHISSFIGDRPLQKCDLSSPATIEKDSHISNPHDAEVCQSNYSFELIDNTPLASQCNSTSPVECPQQIQPTITESIGSNDATQSTTTDRISPFIGDRFLHDWFGSNNPITVEAVWSHSLQTTLNCQADKDINLFLPISSEVVNWLSTLSYTECGITVSLKSFLYRSSKSLPLNSQNDFTTNAGQDMAIIYRFYSFCKTALTYLGNDVELNNAFVRNLLNKRLVIGFCLQLLFHARRKATISRYRKALTKLNLFLLASKSIEKECVMDETMELLDLILQARGMKDKGLQQDDHLKKTEVLEAFDPSSVKHMLSVENVQTIADNYLQARAVHAGHKSPFLLGQGCALNIIRSYNASHNIDLTSITISSIANGIKRAQKDKEPYLVFDSIRRFKGSGQKKANLKLSVPSRYTTFFATILEARQSISVPAAQTHDYLFINHNGSPANVNAITRNISFFYKHHQIKDVGSHLNRHLIETLAQTELDKAKAASVSVQNAESARLSLSNSLLHSAETANRYYNHRTNRQAALRSAFIENSVFREKETTSSSRSSSPQDPSDNSSTKTDTSESSLDVCVPSTSSNAEFPSLTDSSASSSQKPTYYIEDTVRFVRNEQT